MFTGCTSLEKINTKIFKESNFTDLNYFFKDCESLEEIDLSYFESKYITELIGTFYNCKSLEKINLTNFDFSEVKTINNIFYNCIKLKSINISMTNTSNLIDAGFAFSNCISLENINLPNNLIYLESTENMFENCIKLTSINLGFLEGDSKLNVTRGMFKGCSSLIEIIFPNIDAKKISDASELFLGCTNLTNANLEGLISDIDLMESTFYDCKSLINLNILNLDTKAVKSFEHIFEGIEKKMNITYNRVITGTDLQLAIKKNQKLQAE